MVKLTLEQINTRLSNSRSRDYLFLGGTPHEEECTQVGGNLENQKFECIALAGQLQRMYGTIPDGCYFMLIENHHEFGTYYDLGIMFDFTPEPEEADFLTEGGMLNEIAYNDATAQYAQTAAEKYAYKLERLPEHWDEDAKAELRTLGHTGFQPAKVIQLKVA